MRRKIVAGNWKMNKDYTEAKEMAMHLNTWVRTHKPSAEVIIAPSSVFAVKLERLTSNSNLNIAFQDVSSEESGAFTGETAASQIKSVGIKYCLVGHSERREYHKEQNIHVAQKAANLIKNGLTPIVCVGETLEQRKNNAHFNVVKEQVLTVLDGHSDEDLKAMIIAYEPVWAIGTGETASPAQAQEMHEFIRKEIASKHGQDVADAIRILYGGSVKVGNARDLFSQPDIDGGLVGGASLDYSDFTTIIHAAN